LEFRCEPNGGWEREELIVGEVESDEGREARKELWRTGLKPIFLIEAKEK
jgi:hypothetical protein